MKRVLTILTASLCLLACKETAPSGRSTIGYVSDILSGKDPHASGILSMYRNTDADGDICIVDTRSRCAALSGKLMACDMFDNIDGSPRSDLLPDFAGERIVSMIDTVYSPYSAYTDTAQIARLRELTVRMALCAMDTLFCTDHYGFELGEVKPKSKVVILSGTQMADAGLFDLDSLLHASGAKGVKIISTEKLIRDKVFSKWGPDAVYGRIHALDSIPSGLSLIRDFLENYSHKGNTAKISALIVDDFSLDCDSLKAECDRIREGANMEDFEFGCLLAKDFELIDAMQLTAESVYRLMRQENLFTHLIAYPVGDAFGFADNAGVPVLKKYVQD